MNEALRTIAVAAVLWIGFGAASGAFAQAQRSAQSDCAREAERRGYTTLTTRNFQQYKDGWSLELQTRDKAGRVTWSSCFVETRTGDVSLYGLGWSGGGGGSTGNTGNLFEFNCSSTEGKYRECQLPVDGRARLIKQKSDSPCVEGQSWGQRGDRLWVDRGCRAKFEVTFGGSGGGQRVDCRSEQQRYRECPIQRGYVGKLISDLSGGKCRNSGAWGTRDGLVWVNSGCKGRFELVRSSGGSGGGNPGQQQRAEVQCRNQAAREGVSVRNAAAAVLRGSYWETTIDGTRGGKPLRAICRFYPGGNRAELFYPGGSGAGWSGGG